MKILSILAQLLAGAVLLFAMPVFAGYAPSISNCDLINLGHNKWQAKFKYNVELSNVHYFDNTFHIYVPQVNSVGKPDYIFWANRPWATADWNGIVLSDSSAMKSSVESDRILFSGIGSGLDSYIIKSSSEVSVNFSTEGNNAYPILFLLLLDYQGEMWGAASRAKVPYWVTSGSCIKSENVPPSLPHIDDINPPEPAFTMKSAVLELNSVDVGDLPDVKSVGEGYPATIKNVSSNNLCFSYATAAVKKNSYALSVSNSTSTQAGRNLFLMQKGSSKLPYSLKLKSNDGNTANSFQFPVAKAKFITLSQVASSESKRSEMCWTPQVNLFKNASTDAGMHTDTLNFVIIPKA